MTVAELQVYLTLMPQDAKVVICTDLSEMAETYSEVVGAHVAKFVIGKAYPGQLKEFATIYPASSSTRSPTTDCVTFNF